MFAEPQFEVGYVKTVIEGTSARPGALDPLGVAVEPGPAAYRAVMLDLARNMAGCLSGQTEGLSATRGKGFTILLQLAMILRRPSETGESVIVLHPQVASLVAVAVAARRSSIGAAPPAAAHPHVLINMTAGVEFTDDGHIRGVGTEWIFDPEYSAMAIEGLDTNKDGKYSAAELKPLATENMQALKDYSYFIYAYADGRKVKWKDVTDYEQHLGDDGRLRMYFIAEAPEPLDPAEGGIPVPHLRSELLHRDGVPWRQAGGDARQAAGRGCQVKVDNPPDLSETADTRAMLATKGPEWQPDSEEDFGIMFAQPV